MTQFTKGSRELSLVEAESYARPAVAAVAAEPICYFSLYGDSN